MDSFGPNTPQSRKLLHAILRALASVKNQDVAAAIGKDDSTVSRIASQELGVKLNDLWGFLDSLGYKVVKKDQVCIDRDVFESYKTLAKAALVNPQRLNWDEPE